MLPGYAGKRSVRGKPRQTLDDLSLGCLGSASAFLLSEFTRAMPRASLHHADV